MKKYIIAIFVVITIVFEISFTVICLGDSNVYKNDAIKINELKKEIEINYGNSNKYPTYFDYTILDDNGEVIYKTQKSVSMSLNEAYKNRDTIVDFSYDNGKNGKIIVFNNFKESIEARKTSYIIAITVIVFVQVILMIIYYIYMYKNIIHPFKKMKNFATRISNGNLDIPLEMDKNNNFGAFTEAFDIMRAEIVKSRASEKKAIEAKKELVAKLSHDIKTPISSIKSYSELGIAVSNEEKSKDYFKSINQKSDQMSTMITNLFNATLEELEELPINPTDLNGNVVESLISSADYLGKSNKIKIPSCIVYADKLRLQQVFDNIFINSYKYANTNIETKAYIEKEYLVISIRDFGTNLNDEEIPLLTEKFKRGSNTDGIDGTGLGLYISKELLRKMNGDVDISSGNPGFKVEIFLRLK